MYRCADGSPADLSGAAPLWSRGMKPAAVAPGKSWAPSVIAQPLYRGAMNPKLSLPMRAAVQGRSPIVRAVIAPPQISSALQPSQGVVMAVPAPVMIPQIGIPAATALPSPTVPSAASMSAPNLAPFVSQWAGASAQAPAGSVDDAASTADQVAAAGIGPPAGGLSMVPILIGVALLFVSGAFKSRKAA